MLHLIYKDEVSFLLSEETAGIEILNIKTDQDIKMICYPNRNKIMVKYSVHSSGYGKSHSQYSLAQRTCLKGK